MMVAELGLGKPSAYADLGQTLQERGFLSDRGYVDVIKTIAVTRNVLAHAYRRMGVEDLNKIVDEVLPKAEDLIGSELMRILEDEQIDPPGCGVSPSKELSEVFARHGVVVAYLFGSRARGTARGDSDYDLAVVFRSDDVTILDEMELAKDVAEALKVQADKVDVTALNRADSPLLARVFKEGKVIYASNDRERKDWERKAYLNLLRLGDLDAVYIRKASKRIRSRNGRSTKV